MEMKRVTAVFGVGTKAIPIIAVFVTVFAVFVGMNTQNMSAGNAEKGIKSIVDVTAGTTPTIDGTLSAGEWDDAASLDISVTGGATAHVYLKHDGTKLCIGFEVPDVTDDGFSDRIEVLLDLDNSKDTEPQTGDFRLIISRDDLYMEYAASAGEWGGSIILSDDWNAKATSTATAWSAEFAIPYAKVGVTAGTAKTIGLDFLIKDYGTSPVGFYYWHSPSEYDDFYRPNTWGTASSSDNWYTNQMPNLPTLTAPANNAWIPTGTPTFTWAFSDPNAGDTQGGFMWQADNNSDFSSPEYTNETVSNISSYTPATAIPDGVWYWRVKTKDNHDAWSGWSSYFVLKIDTVYPYSHDPISINGNSDFTEANGVVSGNGTEIDPYIIENWDINAGGANGIEIRDTDVYFIIRDCVIHDGYEHGARYYEGIYLLNVINGKIKNVTSYTNSYGIHLSSSSNNNISTNHIYNNWDGIYLEYSSNNNISTNHIYNSYAYFYFSDDGISLAYSSNNNITGVVRKGKEGVIPFPTWGGKNDRKEKRQKF